MGSGASSNKYGLSDSVSAQLHAEYDALFAEGKMTDDEIRVHLSEKYSASLEIDASEGTATKGPSKRLVHIFHFNDVYNFDPAYKTEPIGGAARFATVLEQLKKKLADNNECRPLILFSGDFVGPSLMSSVTQGAHMIEVLNLIGVDYATFGNHELDYGYDSLKARLAGIDDDVEDNEIGFIDYPKSTAQWVMTNMSEAATGFPLGGESVVRTALFDWGGQSGSSAGQIKIGLLAVSENWLDGCAQVKPGVLVYEDYIESARKAAKSLKEQGAEVVLCISHSRLDNDYVLADAVPEIDLVLGGHDHFYKEDLPKRIIKSGEEWRWTSHVQISLEAGNPTPLVTLDKHEMTTDVALHPQVKALCEKYDALKEKKFDRVLFQTAVPLDPTEETVRYKESLLGNWICDTLAADLTVTDGDNSSDICMIQGFYFAGKAVLPVGNFTLGNLMGIFPNKICVVVLKLSGADVVKTLQLGAKALPNECGSLHHVSARLAYTITVPKSGDATVSNVLFDGAPIDPERVFSVAMTDKEARGKYGYTWLKTAERIINEEAAGLLQDLIKMYCKRNLHNTALNPANPALGRITINAAE